MPFQRLNFYLIKDRFTTISKYRILSHLSFFLLPCPIIAQSLAPVSVLLYYTSPIDGTSSRDIS